MISAISSHPVWNGTFLTIKSKISSWVGQNCPIKSGSLNFFTLLKFIRNIKSVIKADKHGWDNYFIWEMLKGKTWSHPQHRKLIVTQLKLQKMILPNFNKTSLLGKTKLSYPVWKYKHPDWVGQNCPILLGSLNFVTGCDNIDEIGEHYAK